MLRTLTPVATPEVEPTAPTPPGVDVSAPPPGEPHRGLRGGVLERASALSSHIAPLDGLRGIAVLLVLARHSSAVPAPTGTVENVVFGAMRLGWIGVDLFFALSGFLITAILLDAKGGEGYLRSFYARRTLRIFPLYFAFLAIMLAFSTIPPFSFDPGFQLLQTHQGWFWSYLSNVLLVVKGGGQVPMFMSHLWSLSLEEQFYLVWPLVVLLVPLAALPWACVALSAGSVVLRLALALQQGWGTDASYVLMPARMDALLIGGLLAIAIRTPQGRERVRALRRPAGVLAFVGLAALLAWRGVHDRNDPWVQVVGYLLLAIASTALIAAALPGAHAARYQRVLNARPLQLMGKHSYAIYVFQYPVIWVLGWAMAPIAERLTAVSALAWPLVLFVTATGVSFVAARLSWVVLEQPMLALKRYVPRPTPSAVPRASAVAHS